MSSTLMAGLRVQRRVVWALMLRETKTLFGKHKLGYLWAVINAAFQIGVFWVIREVGGFHPPHGMSTPAFLLSGFVPFFIFSNSVTTGMNSVNGNRALLVYPQVYPLDILVARTSLQSAVYIVVFSLLLSSAALLGQKVTIIALAPLLTAFIYSCVLGLGAGALCSSLSLMQPVVSQIVPMIVRVLFFVSGLFFALIELPARFQEILYYNPLCHVIVLARSSFIEGYGRSFVDLYYLFSFSLVTLAAGLLLERYSRHFLDRVV